MALYDLPPLQTGKIRLLRVSHEGGGQIQCKVTTHSLIEKSLEFSALSLHGDYAT